MEKQLKVNMIKKVIPMIEKKERLIEIKEKVKASCTKIIVLDDDPTGSQTVHDVVVLTVWDKETLKDALKEENIIYILTNSRSLNSEEAQKLIREIMTNIVKVTESLNMNFVMVNRGDSTLRGHYPMESSTIKSMIEDNLHKKIHGEIIIPFFKEGNRLTFEDIHWIEDKEWWIPVGETEFAKDPVFGYKSSNLKNWVEEKTEGLYPANEVVSISLDVIRMGGIEKVYKILMEVDDFQKVIVNAVDYSDLEIFVLGLLRAESKGKNFIYRTAASFVRVRAGISDRALLTKKELIPSSNMMGGLIIVGSHVNKSTVQLQNAMKATNTVSFEIDVEKLLHSKQGRSNEVQRIIEIAAESIKLGKNTILYTSRKLIKTQDSNSESNLDISKIVSETLVSIVKNLRVAPRFIIAKGGITSSDVGTKALQVRKTTVLGQIRKGIPVWKLDNGGSYIIFPGNVGAENDLKDIIEQLNGSDD